MNLSLVRSSRAVLAVGLSTLSFLLVLVFASSSYGQADTFFLGNGQGSAFSAGTGTTVLNTVAPVSGDVAAGASSLTIGTSRAGTTLFVANRLVMVHQSTGYTGTVVAGNQSAVDLTNGTVGRWEYARISTISGSTLNFTSPLVNSYANGTTQVVAVPEVTTLTITSGKTLTAAAWDGSSGGIIAFLATGAVSNAGTISAAGRGFRGGALVNHGINYHCADMDGNLNNAQKGEGIYPAGYGASQVARGNKTNGGGGGNCHNSGGGGGGHAGIGGSGSLDWDGVDDHALGGSSLTYSLYNHAAFGGGGGAGEENDSLGTAGAIGGGAVIARAASISGAGTITVAGTSAASGGSDGAGGGGAGGAIALRFSGAATCTVNASGGNGGSVNTSGHGPGGGGSGGVVLIQGSSTACTSGTSNGIGGTAPDGARGAGPTTTNAAGYTGTTTTNNSAFSALTSTLVAPAAAASTGNKPTFSGTASANANVGVYVDGVFNGTTTATSLGAWSYVPVVPLAEGAHTAYVVPTYQGTTGAQSNSRSFTVDTTAPTAPSITTPSGTVVTTSTSLTLSGTAEANATVHLYDGATLIATTAASGLGAWSVSSGTLATGSHSITARATDAATNQSAASVSRTVIVDNTPPVVAISSPTNSQVTNDNTPDILFSVTESNPGTTTCAVDAGAYASCTSPFTASTLSDGPHSASVRHVDAAGNSATATRSFIVDTTNPSVSISAPTSGQATNDSTPDVVFTTNDANPGTTTCSVDGSAFSACSSPFTAASLANGTHAVSVKHLDAGGNSTTAVRSFVVDTIAPQPPVITYPDADVVTSFTTGELVGTSEPNALITSYADGYAYASVLANASGNWVFPSPDPAPDGTYTISTTATDAAGNVSGQSVARVITIDTVSPTVTISEPTAGQFTTDNTPDVTFSVVDSNLGQTACSIDNGAFNPCTSVFTMPSLIDGSHTVTVRHTDQAGNTGSASRTFNVDTGPPVVTIVSPTEGSTTSDSTPDISFTVNERNSGTSRCSIDNGAPVVCTSPFTASTLTDGSHTVTVSHTDAAGNIASILRGFRVDTTPPAAPAITTPPGALNTNDATPTLLGGAEIGSLVTIFDGAGDIGTALVGPSGNWTFTPAADLSEGTHSITARATDPSGNQSGASSSRSVTVDTIAPAAPSITSPATDITTNSASPTISGTAEANALVTVYDGASPIGTTNASGAGTWSFTPASPLNQTDHSLTTRARDLAGNQSPASSPRLIAVDTANPNIMIVGPTEGQPLSNSTPSIEFVTSDVHPGTTKCAVDFGAPADCTSSFVTPALSDGPHTVTISHTDTAGNAAAATRGFIIDTIAPAPPVVTTPPEDVVTSFTSGVIGGTAEPNAVITGSYYGTPYGATPTNAAGQWIFASGSSIGEFTYVLSYTATDAAGNESAPAFRTITVDTTNPVVTVQAPGSGEYLADNTPDVSFTSVDTNPGINECSVDHQSFSACSSPFTTPALVDGTHSVTVRHTDAAGNLGSSTVTFIIDATPPVVTITSPTAGQSLSDTTPDIAFTFSERNQRSSSCSIDGSSPVLCTSPFTAATLSDGSHTAVVTYTDAAGNVGSSTRQFTVDTALPAAPVITSPAAALSTNDATPALSGTAEPDAAVTILDGGTQLGTAVANSAGIWNFTPALNMIEGAHVVSATATDAAGNRGPASSTRTITIDVTKPLKPVIISPTGTITTPVNKPLFSGTAEPNTTLSLFTGNSPVASTTADGSGNWSVAPVNGLNDATHFMIVRATDAAGNTSVDSDQVTVIIDRVGPNINVTSPIAGEYVADGTPDIAFNIVEIHPGVTTCSVDGSTFVACVSPFTTDPLADGPHSVRVRHVDAAGNTATALRSFTIDTTSPVVAIDSPAEGSSISNDSPSLTFSITDASTGTTECSVDDGEMSACTSPFETSNLGEGTHNVSVRYADEAENVATTTRSFIVDTIAPAPPVITFPPLVWTTANVTGFVRGTSEPHALLYAYEGGTEIGHATADLNGVWFGTADEIPADGVHTYTIRAVDAAGNVSGPSSPLQITIDTTDPVVEIDTPTNDDYLADNTPSIFFHIDDLNPGLTTDCSVDDGAFSPCTSPFVTGELSDGEHSVVIRHFDAALNVSTNWVPFVIDTVPPVVTISAPAEGATLADSTPEIEFSVEEEHPGNSECSIDGAEAEICTSTQSLSVLEDGAHTLTISHSDNAGNVDTATRSFAIDTGAPAIPAISSPADNSTTNDASPTVTGTAEANSDIIVFDDVDQIGTTTADNAGNWGFTTSGNLTNGEHRLSATASDAVGNQSPPSSTVLITVDTIAPAAPTITSPAGSIFTNNPTPTFSGTAEANSTVTIRRNESPIGTSIANSAGAWTFTPPLGFNQSDHSITAVSRDSAGNQSTASEAIIVTVDVASPTLTITSPDENQSVSDTTPDIEFNNFDLHPQSTTCSIDGGPAEECTSPVILPESGDGPRTITITSTDTAGNSSTRTRNLVVDTTAPVPPLVTVPNTDIVTSFTSGKIAGTSEPFAIIYGYFMGARYGSTMADASGNWEFPSQDSIGEFTYLLYYTAIDAAGNESAPSETRSITVDTTDPDVMITSPDEGIATNDASPQVSFEVNEANPGATDCRVDGGDPVPCTSPFETAELELGEHNITVRHVDAAGNVGSATRDIFVDTDTPIVEIAAPLDGASTNDSSPTVVFDVGDSSQAISMCAIDDSEPVNCSSPWNTGALSDGEHSVSVSHSDSGGNVGSAASAFTVDTAAPNAPSILSPAGSLTTNDVTPEFIGTAAPFAAVRVLDGIATIGTVTADQDGAWRFVPSSDLGEGSHSIATLATDAAGNQSEFSETREITIDTTAPDSPTITSPSSNMVTNDVTPTLVGTAEAGSTVNVYDGSTPIGSTVADESGNWEFTPENNLNQATHGVSTKATDAAGNSSGGSFARMITIDTSNPAVAIASPSEGQMIGDNTPEFIFSTNDDNASTTTCQIDGGTPSNCASPATSPELTDGSHSLTVTSSDQAGNVAAATRNFVVDTAAPQTLLSGTPQAIDGNNDPAFVFSSNAVHATFECKLDDGDWSTCTSPLSFMDLTDSSHAFSVRSTDEAGNTDTSPPSFGWTIDTIAPAVPVLDQPHDPTITTDRRPTFSGTAETGSTIEVRNGSTVLATATTDGSGAWQATPNSDLAEDGYQAVAYARDDAGNLSGGSNLVHLDIDATAPNTTVTSAPGSFDNNPNPEFAFASNEDEVTFECNVDDTGWSACASQFQLSGLLDGAHTVLVRATDNAGNVDDSVAEIDWTLDMVAPGAPAFESPANGSRANPTHPHLTGAAEARAIVTIYVDGEEAGTAAADAQGNWSLTLVAALGDGDHSVLAVAKDRAGNLGAQSDELTFAVDAIAPTGSVTRGLDSATGPMFVFSTSDSTATTTCSVDGGVWVTCSSPFSSGVTAPGSHELDVRFTDQAGNATTERFSFEIAALKTAEPPAKCVATNKQVSASIATKRSSTSSRTKLRVDVANDQFIVAKVTVLKNGKTLLSSQIRTFAAGKHSVAVKVRRQPKSARLSLRIGVLTYDGLKQIGSAASVADDCSQSTVPVNVSSSFQSNRVVKPGTKKIAITALSNQFALSTFTVVQNGHVLGRKVALLPAGKATEQTLSMLGKFRIAKGKATLKVSTISVDGARVLTSKSFAVK
jgi:hypothetical protein